VAAWSSGGQTPAGGRTRPVADRLRAHPVTQDERSRRPRDPPVGGSRARDEREDRPRRAHHRPPARARHRGGVRPHRIDRTRLRVVVAAPRVAYLARCSPGSRRAHRGRQVVLGHDDRRRLLVRDGVPDARPAPLRSVGRRTPDGRRAPVGGNRRGGRGPRAARGRGSPRGDRRSPVHLCQGRTHAELDHDHSRDGARALRRPPRSRRPPRRRFGRFGRADQSGQPDRRRAHALPLCAGPRPTSPHTTVRVGRPRGARGRLRPRRGQPSATRPATPRRAGRGRQRRAPARPRRAGVDRGRTRDPTGDGVARPRAAERPLWSTGDDGREQPPSEALPLGDLGSLHARLCEPSHRGGGGVRRFDDERWSGWTEHDPLDERPPARASRRVAEDRHW
jgi:hypothetical protein